MDQLTKERKMLLQEIEGLLSLITLPILVVESSSGLVFHANTSAENLWLASQAVLLNRTLHSLVDTPKLLEYVKKGKSLIDFELGVIDSRGKRHPFTCRLYPLFVERRVEGAILQFSKISIEKEFEKKQRHVTRYTFEDFRGNSPAIVTLKEQAIKIANSDSTILIRGESGTGKEVLAQSIHHASPRKNGPFVAINCAAIPESLLESELFGYEEGAFTGAKKGGKPGRFEIARNGTLFLDEIGDMPQYLQAKLLRVLQERRIERVGGSKSISINIRLIAATHKDLESMMVTGKFREDLFYRLNVIPLSVPPLRERKDDLYDLIQFYLKWFGEKLGKEPKRFSTQALKCLLEYEWPGNIRELENTIEYIVNLEIGDLVTISSLPSAIRENIETKNLLTIAQAEINPTHPNSSDSVPLSERLLEGTEEHLILQALKLFGKSTEGKRKAAQYLGISVATLYRRLNKMNKK